MTVDERLVQQLADQILIEGRCPDVAEICDRLGGQVARDEVQRLLDGWRASLPGRVVVLDSAADRIPEGLQKAVSMIWQDAVHEAVRVVSAERRSLDDRLEQLRAEAEPSAGNARADYETLQHSYELAQARADDASQQVKMLEAELAVLRGNLTGEVTQRRQLEERVADLRAELQRAEKQAEEMRRTFDARLRDEQNHAHEQLMKAEAEGAHLRRTLEQVRDEASKKESALTRNLHEVQAELVKRDVRIETLTGQIKSQENELKQLRKEHSEQKRELSKQQGQLLAESNRARRLEEQVRKLEEDLRKEKQKQGQLQAEMQRKEGELRAQIRARDEELMRTREALNTARKKQVSQDEVIRRLTQQVNG